MRSKLLNGISKTEVFYLNYFSSLFFFYFLLFLYLAVPKFLVKVVYFEVEKALYLVLDLPSKIKNEL